MKQTNQIPGLYDPSFEHDNCGIGACVNIKGVKNHQTVDNALKIVETLEHRAGKDTAGDEGGKTLCSGRKGRRASEGRAC